MIIERIVVGTYQANCYIVAAAPGRSACIIDPGSDAETIRQALARHSLKPGLVINTHGHIDHIQADGDFGVPVCVHERDLPLLKQPELNLSDFLARPFKVSAEIRTVAEGDIIENDGVRLAVLHMPGHTPGGMALVLKDTEQTAVFTGDSLFRQSIGRTDFPGSDETALLQAIKTKLLRLPDSTVVYPGHGPSSTIGEEKSLNPFVS